MRVAVLLCLVVPSAAAAQAPLFSDGTTSTRTAAPHWRLNAGAGLSGVLSGVATLGVEGTVSGPFAVGGRGVLYTEGGIPQDDGGGVVGVGADVVGSVGTRSRVADLRAFAGAGASVVRYYSGGLVEARRPSFGGRALRPHLVGGVGLDVYPLAGVGAGVEVRVVASSAGALLSTVSLGLRVRLAR